MASNQEIAEKLRDMAVNTGTLNCLGCGFEHNCSVHGCAVLKQAAELISQPNEPLTQADLDGMDYDKVWIDYEDGTGEWALVCNGYIYSIDTLEGAGLDFVDYMRGERLEPHGYKAYRRPPEGENHHG